jgi:hypothetical protein
MPAGPTGKMPVLLQPRAVCSSISTVSTVSNGTRSSAFLMPTRTRPQREILAPLPKIATSLCHVYFMGAPYSDKTGRLPLAPKARRHKSLGQRPREFGQPQTTAL